MDADKLRGILNSDFKLWSEASTAVDEGVVTKTILLPHGIGEFTLVFEGADNAQGRRNAAGIWGKSIRDAVDNAVGEESVSARAAQGAARTSTNDGDDGRRSSTDAHDAAAATILAAEAVSTFGEVTSSYAVACDKLDGYTRRRNEAAKLIKGLDLEIKALQAYMEVMNAQEVQDKENRTPSGEVSSEAFPDGES